MRLREVITLEEALEIAAQFPEIPKPHVVRRLMNSERDLSVSLVSNGRSFSGARGRSIDSDLLAQIVRGEVDDEAWRGET